MDYICFEHQRQVREVQLDSFGHMNHAQYLVMLEDVRWDIIESRNYGIEKIQESQQGPTILEVQLQFKRELINREQVLIQSQCQKVKSKICYFKQEIFKEDGKIALEANYTFALFDTKLRKLVTPTPEWLYAIGAG